MQFDLTVAQVLAIIRLSRNPEYVTSLIDGTEAEYIAKFPAIGTKFEYKEEFFATVHSIETEEGRVRYEHPKVRYYPTEECNTTDNNYEKTDRYPFSKAIGIEKDSISINDWIRDYKSKVIE